MEMVISRSNMMAAYDRVVSNKGAPGVDVITVSELKSHLQQNWPSKDRSTRIQQDGLS
ncbi:MAG: hypothetical protein ACYDAI_16905 [Trichloromonadaceae bacterium]